MKDESMVGSKDKSRVAVLKEPSAGDAKLEEAVRLYKSQDEATRKKVRELLRARRSEDS